VGGKVTELALQDLCAEARQQEHNFVGGLPSDGGAGLELFRRAIVERDDAAWTAVMTLYRGLLLAQTGRQVVRGLVLEDDGFCVDRAFQRFWRATQAGRMHQFSDLGSILKYLKLCLASVMLDEARARRRQATTSLDRLAPGASISTDPTAEAIGRIARAELWRAIESELRDERERLVARLSFVGGLTPREIYARHPQRFGAIGDVYRVKRNVLERLRHSGAIGRLVD
jgi:DNA-directed RNA polymerase specialized sigma24 family protein